MTKKQKKMRLRIIISLVLFVILFVCEHMGVLEPLPWWAQLLIFAVPYLIVGYDIIFKAVRNISHGQIFDENFLMMIATFGAFGVGEYLEAVAVMLFYQVGELFQGYAVGKSRQSITEMMDICPEYANVEEDGKLVTVDPDDVEVGTIIVVKPGERIPLDGVVIEGESLIDTAALTGESVPRRASEGDEIISGCVNGSGTLKIRTTKEFDDSTVAKILELVENASSKKAKVENFITRFAKYYTPVVTIGAVLLAVIPPFILGGGFAEWIQRACIFLVISCPCALVISVPLGFFGGIGAASKIGVLVKGSNFLEAVAEMTTIVFDKTGTLTKATPTVKDVVVFGEYPKEEALRIAACLEEHFPHSMAKAVVDAAKERNLSHEEMHSKVEYIVAHGISSYINDKKVVIGSSHFVFEDEECTIDPQYQDRYDTLPPEYSHLYLAIEHKLAAVICIEDPLREEAAEMVKSLKAAGITKVVMMTGDSERTAAAIAKRVGVDEYYAEVLPEDKANFVEKEKSEGRKVIMIGDGINDSPALSAADAGIAISDGAEIAREIADITIAADDLREVVTLKLLSNLMLKRIHRNYRSIVGINSGLIVLGVTGMIQPTMSALLHNTSTLLISLRSMRNLLPEKEKVEL